MEKRSFEELYNEILNEYKDTYRKKQIESLKSSIKETYNKYPIDFLVIMCLGIIFSIALKKFLILYFFAFYLLIYFLSAMSEDQAEIIGRYTRDNGCKIINIYSSNYPKYYCTSPREFLYLVKNTMIYLKVYLIIKILIIITITIETMVISVAQLMVDIQR